MSWVKCLEPNRVDVKSALRPRSHMLHTALLAWRDDDRVVVAAASRPRVGSALFQLLVCMRGTTAGPRKSERTRQRSIERQVDQVQARPDRFEHFQLNRWGEPAEHLSTCRSSSSRALVASPPAAHTLLGSKISSLAAFPPARSVHQRGPLLTLAARGLDTN